MRPLSLHPAWIEIDTVQFKKNVLAIKKRVGKSLFCLPVKANAYGHGLVQMGKIGEAIGVDSLGVSCLQEGAELRLHGISIPIVIFGAIHENQIEELVEFDLQFSISSEYKAEMVAKRVKNSGRICKIHLEVDTGMRRTGVRVESAPALLSLLDKLGCFDVVGIYSHLATADLPKDPFALSQIEAMKSLQRQMGRRGILFHLANSGGVAHYPDSYFDMVRPGLLSYGYFPDGGEDPEGEIEPSMSLKAKVSYFKVVSKGAGISYGHLYQTEKMTRIATIPLGYGDGYRRSFYKNGAVLIRNKRFPIAGAICMDQFMVDLGSGEAYVGDEVVLIGKQGEEEISLWELAKSSGSVAHELLVAFNSRLPRIYLP